MTRVLITGASGFVGLSLARALAQAGFSIRAAARHPAAIPPHANVSSLVLPDLAHSTSWGPFLAHIDTVIHLAGIAHAGGDIPEADYDQINRAATESLARAAAGAGVKHFIFMSSIRAQTGPSCETPLNESTPAQPTDAYGRSKLAAESAVAASAVPYTILRPVVIYGPGVKANMQSLLRLADSSLPLPFAGFDNLRSLLAMENLVSALRLLIEAGPRNETYVIADPAPVTFAEILLTLRKALGRAPRLIDIPQPLLLGALKALGKQSLAERIGATLVADAHKLRMAGWRPPVDTIGGLTRMAEAQSGSPRENYAA